MAKRTTQSRTRKSSPRSSSSRSSSSSASKKGILDFSGLSDRDFKQVFKNFTDKAAVRYAAGGIGLFVLGRLAVKLSSRYPQVLTYFKDSLEEIEGKLSEYRGSSDIGTSDVDEARH